MCHGWKTAFTFRFYLQLADAIFYSMSKVVIKICCIFHTIFFVFTTQEILYVDFVYNAFPRMRFYMREHYILTENQTVFFCISPTFVPATALPGSPTTTHEYIRIVVKIQVQNPEIIPPHYSFCIFNIFHIPTT